MAKPNYRHANKQKEAARKARQDAKHQRKNAPDAPGAPGAAEATEPSDAVGSTVESTMPAAAID